MTKRDYIEKITQNLEHLTKDELKDVSILTTAQYGVRLKVAEKEYLEKEIASLTPQLQQQALPVVPECVDMAIKQFKNDQLSLYGSLNVILSDRTTEIYVWISEGNQNTFALAFITGKYQVEKPQLFYLKHIDMSKKYNSQAQVIAFGHDDGIIDGHAVVPAETFPNDSKYKFTQAEIDSMQTGSYEQIEVAE